MRHLSRQTYFDSENTCNNNYHNKIELHGINNTIIKKKKILKK